MPLFHFSEQIVSSLSSFFLAMVIHPEAQARSQEELDAVVGRDRLPEFGDRTSLPYIDAIVKEVIRWNPVAPLGLKFIA
jgi:cytochrome P450